MKTPEYYPDKLERECKEMEETNPIIKKVVDEVLKVDRMTSMNFDYNIEKKHLMYTNVAKVLEEDHEKELIGFAEWIDKLPSVDKISVHGLNGEASGPRFKTPKELLTQFRNKQQDHDTTH